MNVVQTSLCNNSITAGCGSLPRASAVGCRCIGVRNIPFRIGAFFGIVALGFSLKADNIGTTVKVIEISTGAVVVIGTVGEVGTVGTTVGSRCKA